MGILNVTPDSFSDGGRHRTLDSAVSRAWEMVEEGAHIVDIGGESTRPGADPVDAEEECRRVIPVIEALRDLPAVISIDTSKAEVMSSAAEAGAGMINDVRALREPGALEAAAAFPLPVCLMHMRGAPRTMQHSPKYDDVVRDVCHFLEGRIASAENAGIDRRRIIVDPGFGFGKNLTHNHSLMVGLPEIVSIGCPVLVGVSRKSMYGQLMGRDVGERLAASLATAMLLRDRGATLFRVHDVRETRDALGCQEWINGDPDSAVTSKIDVKTCNKT